MYGVKLEQIYNTGTIGTYIATRILNVEKCTRNVTSFYGPTIKHGAQYMLGTRSYV